MEKEPKVRAYGGLPLRLPPHTRSFDRVPERVAPAPCGAPVMG